MVFSFLQRRCYPLTRCIKKIANQPCHNVIFYLQTTEHTYIIGRYNPLVRIIDLVSHITYVMCVNFIHKWRDLQFKVDSKRQVFCETFHGNFIYSQSFCQKSAACVYHLLRSVASSLLFRLHNLSVCFYNKKKKFLNTVLTLNVNFFYYWPCSFNNVIFP